MTRLRRHAAACAGVRARRWCRRPRSAICMYSDCVIILHLFWFGVFFFVVVFVTLDLVIEMWPIVSGMDIGCQITIFIMGMSNLSRMFVVEEII